MSELPALRTMLTRLGFTTEAAAYTTGVLGIDTLDEIAIHDGDDDVENLMKRITRPGGVGTTTTTGSGSTAVTTVAVGHPVSLRAETNFKLCVYYLMHLQRVQRTPVIVDITLELVRGYREQQKFEKDFKVTAVEPVIDDKNWPRTLENIKEYLASQYGQTGATLDYVIRQTVAVEPEDQDPADLYETVDQEMSARAPHTGRAFTNDKRKVWDIMSNICGKHSCFIYIKPALRTKNGREAFNLLFDHFLGPNNVGNMASAAETKLQGTLYNGEKKRFTWETYVRIHTEQHSVLDGLMEHGYSGIDGSSKVRLLLAGVKTQELDVCKAQVMASPVLRADFNATVELYSTFIKQMKASVPQMNVSEVSFARGTKPGQGGGGKSKGKRGSSGISNVTNANVDDRFFEKHEYEQLTGDQKNTLRLKRLKRGHVGNGQGNKGNGNASGKGNGNYESKAFKSMARSIAALNSKFEQFTIPEEDEESAEEEVETSNRTNSGLTRQTKKKGKK